ncbi:hypothetical protein BJ508DRAFT_311455 [Ascobolus immersus RN42]|uniref:Uncharacterized protein n=1 Tax=Ascobolus immersus RN42 TaxID=1160509 RepID=A0A3N4HQE0_ASCIM|nr:hypothetical protein BJ508DRAFT_311455 [Ascobolus immersus RN42]
MYWLTLSLLSIPFLLNVSFLTLLILYTVSYTNPFLTPLRKGGTRSFNIVNVTLIIYAVTTGCLNCYLLRSWFKGSGIFKARRLERERIEKHMIRYGLKPVPGSLAMPKKKRSFANSGGISRNEYDGHREGKSVVRRILEFLGYVVVGSLPLILALVLPNIVSTEVWSDGCKNWNLMAEITTPYPTTLQSFDSESNPVKGEVWNVTTRVEFFERGEWVYGMDLFRRLDEPLGFPVDERSDKSTKLGPPQERVIIFTLRNTSAPYGPQNDPPSYVYMGIQSFPSHPYLPSSLDRASLLSKITNQTTPPPTILSRRYPIFGSPYPPIVNSASIGRIIYTLGPQSSQYSVLPAKSLIPGVHPAEQIGSLLTHKENLVFSGKPLSLRTPEDDHRWRYIHPDILHGRRNAEACLPPNPNLVIPGFIDLAVGGTVVKGPAYTTPWLPRELKGIRGSKNCRTWKVCGGGKRDKASSSSAEVNPPVPQAAEDAEAEWKEEMRRSWSIVVGVLAYEVEGWNCAKDN